MRQEAADLRTKIEAEFDKQRLQLDEAFQTYTSRFESDQGFDEAFTSSVVEHLRLARDEGSKLAANAMVEAEELTRETEGPADFSGIRDAINDISKQDSQSSILRSLVEQAAHFAPRGAFFIIKSEHFAGWKVFGSDVEDIETVVRDIHFPVASDTILGHAVRTLATHEAAYGAHDVDSAFLNDLHFGQPDRMYAIPLIARGRGVAVMYVDYGNDGLHVNIEALETLVRIAGLTVELLASSHTARTENREMGAADFEHAQHETAGHQDTEAVEDTQYQPVDAVSEPEDEAYTSEPEDHFEDADAPAEDAVSDFAFSEEAPADDNEVETADFAFSEPVPHFDSGEATADFAFSEAMPEEEGETETVDLASRETEPQEMDFDPNATLHDHPEPASFSDYESTQPVDTESFSAEQDNEDVVADITPAPEFVSDDLPEYGTGGAEIFSTGGSIEPATHQNSPFDQAAEFEPANAGVGSGTHQVAESAVDVSSASVGRPRLSDRNVDLPIEVAEDERRLHNDARRFARLLVSEIKLYNEKKVEEGRQSRDLYERLREAIDRSREMYDKRVQPPVAEKFDYFHYELVNALAEGDADRLGAGYSGSRI